MKKVGYFNGKIETLNSAQVLANPEITERLEKFAFDAKRIAPKSDDFLYFSIIFLKAAESALLDEEGNLKKVGRETAWGYFDDNWRWHGNVNPHKNSNSDIFGEKELKKAYKKWIGAPLCVDHKSDSVDGIRGIILDAHYDEKLKQVVGLCALDKVNYPELARKVETGVVRYGSMGTAVETSICTECGNRAKIASDYCHHVTNRLAWGEINVGLKPIEYSLVVQPAEPGAKLLKCIASLEEHESEIKNYGVDDFSEILEQLSYVQAYQLEAIVKKACGESGCSLDERRNLIVGFLAQNGFMKSAQDQSKAELSMLKEKLEGVINGISKLDAASLSLNEDSKSESMKYLNKELEQISRRINELEGNEMPQISRNQAPEHRPQVDESSNEISQQIQNIPATSGLATHFQNAIEPSPSAGATADGEKTFSAPVPSGSVELNDGIKHANVKTENMTKFSDVEFKSIVEDIMNESRLRKRAELRRRLAYFQGGSEGVEPKTFKSEPASKHQDEDKHMQQDKSMGGDKGMFPGDLQEKEKLKRASDRKAALRATAYFQGGAEGVEPKTFKSEPASKHQGEDKHMHQDKSMGGDKGMFPGDAEAKKKVSRAAYNGPALRTKFVQARNTDGSLNKSASTFKVFAGDKLVINATAEEIYGDELDANWDFISSPEYGKEVVSEIRTAGLAHVAGLLKSAQELPEAAAPAAPEAAPAPMPAPAPEMAAGGEAHAPKQDIEDRLMDMEDSIEDIRELIGQLSDGKEVNVDINVGAEEAEQSDAEKLSLSSTILRQLKLSLAQMDEAADELAMIAETHEGIHNLSLSQQNDLHHLTNDAISDSIKLAGEASALKKIARTFAASIVRTAEYVEPVTVSEVSAEVASTDSETETLIAEAMLLRRNRRNAMLKKAQEADGAHGLDNSADDKKKETLEGNKVTIEAPKGEEVKVTVHHAEADKKEEKEEKKEEKKENDAMDSASATTETHSDAGYSAAQKLVAAKLSDAVIAKKASEEREAYRLKVRRAYDVGMEMQRKGLVANTKTALDRQVDEIMEFDDKAFEAFKRTIANAKAVEQVKTASDLSGLNVGVESTEAVSNEVRSFAGKLSSLWDKK